MDEADVGEVEDEGLACESVLLVRPENAGAHLFEGATEPPYRCEERPYGHLHVPKLLSSACDGAIWDRWLHKCIPNASSWEGRRSGRAVRRLLWRGEETARWQTCFLRLSGHA